MATLKKMAHLLVVFVILQQHEHVAEWIQELRWHFDGKNRFGVVAGLHIAVGFGTVCHGIRVGALSRVQW